MLNSMSVHGYVLLVKLYATETPPRFILDDSALYLTDKCESETVDLRRGTDYSSVVRMSLL